MASFTVAAGTDWIDTLVFGSGNDRWRLDDYDIWLQVKQPGGNTVLLDLSLANGKLIISDPVSRRLEVNVGWSEIEAITPSGPYSFDVLFENKTTLVRSRSGPHTLSITPGITFPEV